MYGTTFRPGCEWRAIASAHAHTSHILFSCAIIARLNFVLIKFRRAVRIEKWRTAQWTLNARCYAKLSCCNNNRIPFDLWTANTWDKQTFILFIFAFFIISELWKHINWSNNIRKRSPVHLLQIKSFQRN